MKKPFSERFEENNKNTLRYDIVNFKRACKGVWDTINDWLIKCINTP